MYYTGIEILLNFWIIYCDEYYFWVRIIYMCILFSRNYSNYIYLLIFIFNIRYIKIAMRQRKDKILIETRYCNVIKKLEVAKLLNRDYETKVEYIYILLAI